MSEAVQLVPFVPSPVMEGLRTYDLARSYLAKCASVDEVAELKDVAAKVAAYARLIHDEEREAWLGEIVCRAVLKLGQECRRLDTSLERARTDLLPIDGKQTKTQVLKRAGISTTTANRYEQLASADDDAPTAAESYYAECKAQGVAPTLKGMTAAIKQDHRSAREAALAGKIEAASRAIGQQLYGVIYIDPPWRFEPYSRETGMDRAADNHYETMTSAELEKLELLAADDCVLFCWVTVPMLPAGLAFLYGHGFAYRTAFFWMKPGPGHGYWSTTDQVEILLVGVKGSVPAPAPGTQPPQSLKLPRGRHSAKPEAFAEMIEAMFPTVPKLEMFARAKRDGWDAWGNEVF